MLSREDTEILRKKYYYQKLIMSGKVKLPIETAKKFVGPDKAYHLYSQFSKEDSPENTPTEEQK